jgi:DNA-binding CsgD family transcriptional regulator
MLDELRALERELAGVLTVQDLGSSFIERLRALTGATGTSVFGFTPDGLGVCYGGTLSDMVREYWRAELEQDDPLLDHARQQRPQETFCASTDRPLDWDAYGHSRAYHEFYRLHDVGFLESVWPTGMPFGSPDMFGILLTTPQLGCPLTASAYRVLRRIEQPLRTAAARIQRYRQLDRQCDMLRSLIASSGRALLVFDEAAHLHWISPAAQRLLAGSRPESELMRAAAQAARQLRRPGAVALEAGVLGRPRRLSVGAGRPRRVEFMVVHSADGMPWLVAELEAGDSGPLSQLTRAEARVLELLAEGLSNREIAERLAVSTETARTHVSRILQKLDVDSRGKAARLARGIGRVGAR